VEVNPGQKVRMQNGALERYTDGTLFDYNNSVRFLTLRWWHDQGYSMLRALGGKE
jgi:hypothetical protein